jgi:uncharacterized protein YdhG (YjbR/CyaY superfamily)
LQSHQRKKNQMFEFPQRIPRKHYPYIVEQIVDPGQEQGCLSKDRITAMKQRAPRSVDDYIDTQSEALRPKLQQVRAAVSKAVPEAVEGIGYGMPGYKLNGKPLLYFAGFEQHYSLFAASGTFFASLQEELKPYEQRKGTIHFPLDQPVPTKLITQIAKLRAAGILLATKTDTGAQKQKRTPPR